LNNYDYADRTRLETYFWGVTQSWKDITEQFRDKLMVAATTQIVRGKYDVETTLNKEIKGISQQVYETLQPSVMELAKRRLQKGGKKDYDLMVALYFNDILEVLKETYRVLKPGGHFCLVLGDSAPYGVHIETDNMIGQLGLGLGFSQYDYHELRRRGEKWKENPQRHRVPLREGIVILTK
jgi:SAM-dependent methyltransferase